MQRLSFNALSVRDEP